jgi:hypothetical protein
MDIIYILISIFIILYNKSLNLFYFYKTKHIVGRKALYHHLLKLIKAADIEMLWYQIRKKRKTKGTEQRTLTRTSLFQHV